MRECWVNVYCSPRAANCGPEHETRAAAVSMSDRVFAEIAARPAYRLHVRLKPDPVRLSAYPSSLYRD